MINIKQIKDLRAKTGLSIAACRQALEAALGDELKALAWLKSDSERLAAKKGERTLGAGVIASYVHSNHQLGTILELCSETDFVAKNEDFRSLANDLAMQVSATSPADTAELLAQPFIKDSGQTISDLIKSQIQKFGERIELGRFARFEIRND
ncbi:MAG: elongation factor Ts [Patescibacteria group bacterium]